MDEPDRMPPLPPTFPRRVLLAVPGLTPQIVTETLYALAVTQDPAWIPTEIRIINMAEGAKRARLSLRSIVDGRFQLALPADNPAASLTSRF